MNMEAQTIQLGSLDCIVVDGGPKPTALAVLCHGFGAPGDDLANLAPYLIQATGPAAASFRWVFPAAPIDLTDQGMPGGRAWWPLNMARLAMLFQTQAFEELHEETPPGLVEASSLLEETITEAKKQILHESDQESVPVVLGGFSQGAMVTLNVALSSEKCRPNVLVQYSGTLICRETWQKQASCLTEVSVIQTHGTADPILPFASAQLLRDMLVAAGVTVDFYAFDGPHTIEQQGIEAVAAACRGLLA
ncbi:MAG: lysophospholipase [Planctomycetota bacterium]